jgi:opacity protein-like surface antigen
VRRFLPLAFFVLSFSLFSAAQSENRVDLFAGYSYSSQDISLINLVNSSGVSGWNASATFPMHSYLGLVADFSGFYPSYNTGCGAQCTSSAKIHTFMAGPQISLGHSKLKPFARFLVGDTNLYTSSAGSSSYTFTSNNAITFGLGGGIDYGLTHRLALRGQVDWLHNGFHTSDGQLTNEEIHNVARISTGVVFHL